MVWGKEQQRHRRLEIALILLPVEFVTEKIGNWEADHYMPGPNACNNQTHICSPHLWGLSIKCFGPCNWFLSLSANSNPCEHAGKCVNTDGAFHCECLKGYAGPRCEMDINECHSDPCQNDATCLDKIGGFTCLCMPGTWARLCVGSRQEALTCASLRWNTRDMWPFCDLCHHFLPSNDGPPLQGTFKE